MLNKKLLAASVAALFAATANAAPFVGPINADATGNAIAFPVFASEALNADLVDGLYPLVIDDGADPEDAALDVDFELDFPAAEGDEIFIRVDLTNAAFANALADNDLVHDTAGEAATNAPAIDIRLDGNAGQSSVIYRVIPHTADAGNVDDLDQGDKMTFTPDSLRISLSNDATIKFGIFETLTLAAQGTAPITSKTATIASVDSAVTLGAAIQSSNLEAIVKDGFTTLTGDATEGSLGGIDASDADMLDTDLLAATGAGVVVSDVILDTAEKPTFTGNFSFGEWTVNDAAACGGTAGELVIADDSGSATSKDDINLVTTAAFLCLDNGDEKDVILRGSYSVSASDNGFSGGVGSITYDTTSVSVPYISTFDKVNQRIYFINSGVAADYSFTFKSEDGITATPGTAASGTIPQNGVLMLKASDIVTITGSGTRTTATIEIESELDDIEVTTQIVNKNDGSTDTVILTPENN
ncbi:hypothetical protein [Agaribacter marinus]|uniref:Uncharacterized protein n=1 Tax=Agaribacter marinus TaxID=1431249 RepID=A0AA37SYW1_9ALTE|nr:hypothetical protein [Agaribacter marinus]GLR70869.1 hypothetical protein GCM10007852_17770 [Agaribacter marinus]